MSPAYKRYLKEFGSVADAVARLDLSQTDREAVARALADTFDRRKDFRREVFVLTASDPLVPCAGAKGEPCPEGREIRVMMHNSDSPDGRSLVWRERAPYGKVRCVSCGAREFTWGRAAA